MSPKLRLVLSISLFLIFSIKAFAQLQFESVVTQDVSCFGGNDGQITINVTGGSSPFQYTIIRLVPSPIFIDVINSPDESVTFPGIIPITWGSYLIIADDGVASVNTTVFVNQPPALLVGITPDPAQACSGSNLQLNGNASGGSGGFTHLWTGPGAAFLNNPAIVNPVFNNPVGGSYDLTYTVTDANNCIAVDNITITNTDNPVTDAGTGGNACGTGFTMSATNSFGTGTWSSSGPGTAVFSNVNDPNATVIVSALGSYTFTWTETNNGCSDTDNVVVTFIQEPNLSLTPVNPSAPGSTDGSIVATVSGGTGPYNYILTDSDNNQTSTGFIAGGFHIFNNLETGDYTVEVIDSNNCNDIENITLSVASSLTVDVQTTPSCSGNDGTITIDITSGLAPFNVVVTQVPGGIVFSTSSSNLNYLVSNLAPGTYNINIQDNDANVYNNNVNVSSGPVATISYPGSPFCGVGTGPVTRTGQAGGTYSSSPAGLVIDANTGSIDIGASTNGTYTVVYNFTDGTCAGSTQTQVVIGELGTVTISYDQDPYCADGVATVTINGLVLNFTESLYTAGLIPSDGNFPRFADNSSCPGSLTVNIPAGAVITGVDVEYRMTGLNSPISWITDQRSQLRVVSPGGISEPDIILPPEDLQFPGSYVYQRNNLNIANGVTGGGNIVFELHAGRIFPDGGCATNRQRVDNNTWRVRVYHTVVHQFYALPAGLVIDAITGEVDLEASVPGTYTVYYEYGDGTCTGIATTQISVLPLPVATINYEDSPYCAFGTATVNRTGQTGGTYTAPAGLDIDPATGEVDLGNSTPGTYTVTYTFTNGTCSGIATAQITINPVPVASISYDNSPYCNTGTASVTRNGQAGGTYSATPAGLSINSSTGAINLATSTPGVYTVTYIFSDGLCDNLTTTTVEVNAAPTATITYEDDPYCAEGIALIFQTGQAGGTYSSTAGLNINSVTGEVNLATSNPGTYTVTYSFTNGTCPGTATTQITINALPQASIAYTGSPYCASGIANVTQTGQPGGAYTADPVGLVINEFSGTIDLEASTPGTYTVTYRFQDANCENFTTTTVVINALPAATISYPGSPYCATGTADVTISGQTGGTFSSTPGLAINSTTGQVNLASSTPGTYTVTYIFSNGNCFNQTSAEIIINALPTASISYPGSPYCPEGTASVVRTGQEGGTYSSTAGLVINPATGEVNLATSTAGTYTVTYSFNFGSCFNSTTTQITIRTLPTASISYAGSPYCATGVANVTLTGQSGGTFSSTAGLVINPATGQVNLQTSTPGSYTVTYDFSDGFCSNSTTAAIEINALPTASISYDDPAFCAFGLADVSITGQTGGTFTSAAGLVINASTGQVDLAASTPGTYTVTYTFSSGSCSNSTTTEITIEALPQATISYPGSPYCATGNAPVTVTGTPGGVFTADPVGLVIDEFTGTISLATSAPGTYTVTYRFQEGDCENFTTTSVTINAAPTAAISYDASPYCASGVADVSLTGQTGGTFTSTAGLVINSTTGQVNLVSSTPGTYTVTYSFTDGTCPNETTTEITINALPTASISYDASPYCATGIATVSRTGQAGGTYSSSAGLVIDPVTGEVDLVASIPNTYTVLYVFDDGLCSNSTTTQIIINALPTASISYPDSPYCATGFAAVTITGQTGGTFSSTPGLVINVSTGEVNLLTSTPGTYTVTYVFSDGSCSNQTTTSITINALPVASISYDASPYCAEGVATVTFTGQPGGTYSSTAGLVIDPVTGEVDLEASNPGTYTVTYDFTDGTCSDSATAEITINALPSASIAYEDSPYCAEGFADVVITGQTGGTFSSTPGLVIDPASGQVDLAASTAGTYTVTYNFTDGLCSNVTTTSIEIVDLPVASIAYDEEFFCAYGTAPVTQTGQTGGTYSSTPGLVIDPDTGEIDLEASASGSYTITYEFTNGVCTSYATADVTIFALPQAEIVYEGSPYCSGGLATVTQTGQDGGVYTAAPVGLIINTFTGTINLDTSIPGTYTVTYRFQDGDCENLTTTEVVINEAPLLLLQNTTDAICANEDSGTITVQAIGGELPYTFELLDADGTTVLQSFESTTTDPFTFTNVPYGFYYVSVNDGNICSSSVIGPVFIDEPDPIAIDPASVVVTPISCIGLTNGSISLTAQGGSGNLIYTLLQNGTEYAGPQINNGTFNDLPAGSYVLSITDDAGCGPVISTTFNIAEPEPFTFNIVLTDIECVSDEASIEVSVSGGQEPYEISLWFEGNLVEGPVVADESETILFAGITQGGLYTVIAVDANLCQDDQDVDISDPLTLNVYNVTGGGAYCADGAGLNVGLDGSDTGISYQLLLDDVEIPGALLAGTGEALNFGLFTDPGTYTVIAVEGVLGCSLEMNGLALIAIDPLPLAFDITGGGIICLGDPGLEIELSGSEVGIEYQLQLDGVNVGPVVLGNGSALSFGDHSDEGTYTIIAQNPVTSCTSQMNGSVTISVGLPPVAVITGDDEICTGESVTLIASGGDNYLWSTGDTDPEITVSPLVTTTYTVTVTNICGVDDESITVTVSSGPVVDLGDDVEICQGETVILDAGAFADVSYLWSDGSTNQTLTVSQSGIYSVIVTNNTNLCSSTDQVEVIVNPVPQAITGEDQVICLGTEITLGTEVFDPVPNTTYLWTSVPNDPSLSDPTISNPTASPQVTTIYTLVEEYTNTGCSSTNDVVITVVGGTPNAGTDQTICAGEPVTLGPAIPGDGNIYIWTSSNPEEVFDTNVPNPVVSPLVTTTYTLFEEYPDLGCSNTAQVVITVNLTPKADAGLDLDICIGESVVIGGECCEPVPLNTYLWISEPNDDSISDPTIPNPEVNPAVTTTYTLIETYIATGCTNQNSITVTVHELPLALVADDTEVCENVSINIGSVDSSPLNSYLWSSVPAGFISTQANPSVIPGDLTLDANNQITFVLNVSSQFCSAENQVTITVNPAPQANIADDMGFCSANEIQDLNLGGDAITGYTYLWDSNQEDGFSSTEANPVVNPQMSTVYTLIVTNTLNGCIATETVAVNISDFDFAEASNPEICEDEITVSLGENISLTGGMQPYQFYWTDAFGNSVSNELNPLISAPFSENYRLTAYDAMNCPATVNIQVEFIPSPEVYLAVNNDSIRGTVSMYVGQMITFQALPSGYSLYEFYIIDAVEELEEENPEVKSGLATGTLVQSGSSNVYAAYDLKDGQRIYVVAYDSRCSGESAVVRVVVNELPNAFTPDGDGINDIFASGMEITIFNRWGQKIYQGTQQSAGWDGNFNGRKVSPGTYYYLLNIYDENNKKTTLKGSVTVILVKN